MAPAPGGPYDGYPGRGAWRFPQYYGKGMNLTNARVQLGLAAIQWALFMQGYGAPDSPRQFDGATELAVKMFQENKGYVVVGPADGKVGRRTARAIFHPYVAWIQHAYSIPSNLLVGNLSWESAWDPGVEGQLDPGDRGFAQISARWHPEVSDVQAYNPLFAIDWFAHGMRQRKNALGRWRPAIYGHKNPRGAEEWARTGAPPSQDAVDYTDAVLERAALEYRLAV